MAGGLTAVHPVIRIIATRCRLLGLESQSLFADEVSRPRTVVIPRARSPGCCLLYVADASWSGWRVVLRCATNHHGFSDVVAASTVSLQSRHHRLQTEPGRVHDFLAREAAQSLVSGEPEPVLGLKGAWSRLRRAWGRTWAGWSGPRPQRSSGSARSPHHGIRGRRAGAEPQCEVTLGRDQTSGGDPLQGADHRHREPVRDPDRTKGPAPARCGSGPSVRGVRG